MTRAVRARGEVHLVRLDPTLGSEIQKTRPCLVVSPDELNQHLRTLIVAPITTGGRIRGACRVASTVDLALSLWISSGQSMPNAFFVGSDASHRKP